MSHEERLSAKSESDIEKEYFGTCVRHYGFLKCLSWKIKKTSPWK